MSSARRALERSLKDVEARLRNRPTSLDLKFERAGILDRLGESDRARSAYVEILQRDPDHFGALNDLGLLLFRAGMRNDAFTCFNAAVAKHPRNARGHANLAFMLLRGGDAEKAREHYEIAVKLDPHNVEAHRGLALAIQATGDRGELALKHRDAAFAIAPIQQLPYRGGGTPIRVLCIVSASAGNVAVDRFLDDRVFAVSKAIAEYCTAGTALPAHDVVFNAIGDADVAADALVSAAALAERSGAPVINAPAAVAATGRLANARRFDGVDGVRVPRTVAVAREALAQPNAAALLQADGFAFPLLLRSRGFHTGANFERVESAADLAAVSARLPGDELLVMEFLDLRGEDGRYRKYRTMFAGEGIYPLHLAIGREWKVHYFSADTAQSAALAAEEERFLREPQAVLGSVAMRALDAIRVALGLQYAGADFSLDGSGRVVLFEANATMIVPAATAADPPYRAAAIGAIDAAVRELLVAAAATRSRRA